MSCFPESAEELEEFNQGFVEGYKEQEKTTGDFQQGPSIPQMATDRRFYGDQMIAPDGYLAFYEQQMTDPQHQINHYGQMTSTSSGGDTIYRGQLKILGGEHILHGYQTAPYRGDQNLCVDPQGTSPVGGQFLYDRQMQTPGFNTVHHGSKKTNSSEEENLFQSPKTTAICEDTFLLGQMKPTSADENVCPGQKRSPNVEGNHNPQRTSFGNQSPYFSGFSYASSYFVAQSQPLGSFSVSPSVQGELPQKKSDLETHSHVTQKKPSSLKQYFCPYQDCQKAYTKSFHLKDHVKKHTGEKPYVCNKPGCSWTFFRSTDLRRHQRKHSGERLFPCPKCNKNFSRLCYLKQHQKICTGASPNAGT